MTVTLAQRSVVEVATFDLGGKALSTVRRTLGAGICSIELPYRGAGVYLYKVKSGNREFVMKGNSVGGISSGSALASQGSSSNHLSKQAKVTAKIKDVIAVKKAGYLNYRCVQYNDDTTGLQLRMIVCADTVRDIDGNVYQAVRIGNQVWMAENLRTTNYNDGSAIPVETKPGTWQITPTPRYCYYNNTTNSDSIKKFGALYNWYVVDPANPKKIAPTGWHVPTDAEWDTLQNYLIAKGYNMDNTTTENKIAKSLAAKTDWKGYAGETGSPGSSLTKNNRSGFSALPGGWRYASGFYNQSSYGYWWSAGTSGYFRSLFSEGIKLYKDYKTFYDGLSVRLVRD